MGKNLRIGWIIPTVGTFGAVREMVEISNELVERGHWVTIYHPDGKPCVWLPCAAGYGVAGLAATAELDVLIGIVDWNPELYALVQQSPATVRAVCLMGFAPSEEMAQSLRGERSPRDKAERVLVDAMGRGMTILADSQWQVDWLQKNVSVQAGPPFGGVNRAMFRSVVKTPRERLRVITSGDPRERKGGDTVAAALDILRAEWGDRIETDSYWNRRFNQSQLVEFLQQGDVFLDGHRRAGWCNPVAEAMACGTAVVCTDIGAVSDFAHNEHSALVVPVDNPAAMAAAASRLLIDPELRQRMTTTAAAVISRFDYRFVAKRLESYLVEKVLGAASYG